VNATSDIACAAELPEALPVPTRSRFYHLEPGGIVTGEIESLTSYIARLAAAHSITVSALARWAIAPLANISAVSGSSGKHDLIGQAGSSINSNGEIAAECALILGLLTQRESLAELTMRFTSGWLATRPLITRRQRWCSRCLKEMNESTQLCYYPLLWHLEQCWICPEHETALESQCRQCGKSHYPLCGRLVVGHCPHCRASLADSATTMCESKFDLLRHQAGVFMARKLERMLAEASQFSQGLSSIWPKNIERLVHLGPRGSSNALAKELGVSPDTVRSWLSCTQLPSLSSLLVAAYALDLDITDIVLRELPPGVHMKRRPQCDGLARLLRAPLKKRDINLLRSVMTEAAENPKFPPESISQVCSSVGCHQSFAARKFPELAEKIKTHRRSYLQISKQQRLYFTDLITKSVASNLAGSGQYPSHRKMCLALPSWISLRDPVAKKAWLELLKEWGWKDAEANSANRKW
jgi:hypothetical protein